MYSFIRYSLARAWWFNLINCEDNCFLCVDISQPINWCHSLGYCHKWCIISRETHSIYSLSPSKAEGRCFQYMCILYCIIHVLIRIIEGQHLTSKPTACNPFRDFKATYRSFACGNAASLGPYKLKRISWPNVLLRVRFWNYTFILFDVAFINKWALLQSLISHVVYFLSVWHLSDWWWPSFNNSAMCLTMC